MIMWKKILGSLVVVLSFCSGVSFGDEHSGASVMLGKFTEKKSPLEISVRIKKEPPVLLLEPLELIIEARYPHSLKVGKFVLPASAYEPSAVLLGTQTSAVYWAKNEDILVKKWTYRLAVLEAGMFRLKPFRLYYQFRDGRKKRGEPDIAFLQTGPIEIPVEKADVAVSDLIPNVTGVVIPSFRWSFLVVGIVVWGVLALFLVRWRLVYLKGQRREQKADDKKKTAGEQLQKIRVDLANGPVDTAAVYCQIDEILRYALGRYLNISTGELNAGGFWGKCSSAESKKVAVYVEELVLWWKLAERIRFASLQPSEQQVDQYLKLAERIVDDISEVADGDK